MKKIIAAIIFCALLAGCTEPITTYRVFGHKPEAAKTVLVPPFLDARTFRDKNDKANEDMPKRARKIFIEELKRCKSFKERIIIAPNTKAPVYSRTPSDILEQGKMWNADLVVAGQIFSFTETRAASIPPRAGMFIRIFSTKENKLVFVGDHYQAAGAPGSKGGREEQARQVARAIINSYTASYSGPGTNLVLKKTKENAPKVLMLPYHERNNPNNLIEHTGGGAVVTALYGMELGVGGALEIMDTPASEATHEKLLTPEQAVALGKKLGADFVVRGQVVEFKRAMSVPSLFSAVISTAILAAQILFAETSGVDIATEIWRVSDGKCIYANRSISHQKYVVQAEKTVRQLALLHVPVMRKKMTGKTSGKNAEPVIDRIIVNSRVARNGQPAANNKDEAKRAKIAESIAKKAKEQKAADKKKAAEEKAKAKKAESKAKESVKAKEKAEETQKKATYSNTKTKKAEPAKETSEKKKSDTDKTAAKSDKPKKKFDPDTQY